MKSIRTFLQYQMPDCPLTYYRSASGIEIDFILGDQEIALEVKASSRIHEGHWKNFKALKEDGLVKKCIVVSLEETPRKIASNIEILPYQDFIERLWAKEYIK